MKPVPSRCGSMHVSEILGRRQCERDADHEGPHSSLQGTVLWEDVPFRINYADEEPEAPRASFWQRFKTWWTE